MVWWWEGGGAFIFDLVGLILSCIPKFSFLGYLQVPLFGEVVVIVVVIVMG